MTFDEAMDEYDAANPVGTIADSSPFTLGGGPPVRPALTSPGGATTDPSAPADDASESTGVNMAAAKRWTHVRVPIALHRRLEALARKMEQDHAEGRISLSNAMCERVPAWFVIAAALDEQEARRGRSRRPRRNKQSV